MLDSDSHDPGPVYLSTHLSLAYEMVLVKISGASEGRECVGCTVSTL